MAVTAATHEEILGMGLWRKNISYTLKKLVGLHIRSVIRMVIVTRRDEQSRFVVLKYLSRRSNLVSVGMTTGSSTGELGFGPLRDGGFSLHHLTQTGSGADPPCHLMSTGSFPLGKAAGV
jgi:hypothetical protein